jgi:hypothetical protein
MTRSKTFDRNQQAADLLDDAELNAVVGGAIDNCIPVRTVTGIVPNTGWTFKDLFAKPTLGTYH